MEWRKIIMDGYTTIYSVSSTGEVRNDNTGYILKKQMQDGYMKVGFTINGNMKRCSVHRLVATAFIPNPNNLPIVNHKDENPKNNSINNLEWCDAKYNVNYGTRNERAAAKISQKNSKAVYCIELNKIFKSQTEAAKELGISQGNISSCCAGKLEKTGGYHFRSMAIEEVKGDK